MSSLAEKQLPLSEYSHFAAELFPVDSLKALIEGRSYKYMHHALFAAGVLKMLFCQTRPVFFLLLFFVDGCRTPPPTTPTTSSSSVWSSLGCRLALVWGLFVLRDSHRCIAVTPLILRSRSGGCCQERLDLLKQHRPLLVPSRAAAFGHPGLRGQILREGTIAVPSTTKLSGRM